MSKYFDLIKSNIDAYGLIANMPGNDEGDSSNREGVFAVAMRELYYLGKISSLDYASIQNRYATRLLNLKCGAGGLRRGLDTKPWTYQDCVMSRDQWIPNAIAAGSLELQNWLDYLFLGHLRRGLLFTTNTCPDEVFQTKQNWKIPDLTILSSHGIYIRSYKFWPLYPLLWLFDLEILVNSLIIVYQSYSNPAETDVVNHICKLIQAKRRLPTLVSWLATKVLKLDKRGMQACLDDYFSPSLNEPQLNKLFADILPTLI